MRVSPELEPADFIPSRTASTSTCTLCTDTLLPCLRKRRPVMSCDRKASYQTTACMRSVAKYLILLTSPASLLLPVTASLVMDSTWKQQLGLPNWVPFLRTGRNDQVDHSPRRIPRRRRTKTRETPRPGLDRPSFLLRDPAVGRPRQSRESL
jgi:hypothetical protein